MSDSFNAFWVEKEGDGTSRVSLRRLSDEDLMDGDVLVDVEYSGLNYKDGLALTGKSPIIRRFPLIPGIDFAGTVRSSDDPSFTVGDPVLLTGFGVGESHHGGFAQRSRVPGEWLVKRPAGMTARKAMALGTAGFTAMRCVLELERHGLSPTTGPVVVTGAAGGVGSIAVSILARLGYDVAAVTGRVRESAFLRELGAAEILDRAEFAGEARPLASERWAGGVDVAGGNTLANVLSQIRRGGAVAACGLADSMRLPGSMAPFILRDIALLGVSSVMTPMEPRKEVWRRLVNDLDLDAIEDRCVEIGFSELLATAESILAGRTRGRVVVQVG